MKVSAVKVSAVIDNAAINNVTGFRKLVDEKFFNKSRYKLMIEVKASTCGSFIPVDDKVRSMFPEIKREFISDFELQY